jgi:hypothetical protein
MISPLLDEKIRDKIIIIDERKDILKYVDRDQLSPDFLGTSDFEYSYPDNVSPDFKTFEELE